MRRAPALLLSLFVSTVVQAAIYENTVEITDEDDLFAAEQRGDISEATRDTLLELFNEGVDLNSAGRDQLYDLPSVTYQEVDGILEYRKVRGHIADPAELVGAGVITAEQLLEIAPYILLIDGASPLPVSVKARLITTAATTDTVAPPALLKARVKMPFDLSAGVLLNTSRRQPGTPRYDPIADALVTDGFGYHLHVPRLFVGWLSGKRKVILGTYTIGFAERLTLDNTSRATPYGLYLTDDYTRSTDLTRSCKAPDNTPGTLGGDCDPSNGRQYITPDFRSREVFRGVAGSIEALPVGQDMSLSLYGFLSYQTRTMYQYDVYDRRDCLTGTESTCFDTIPVYLNEGVDTGNSPIRYSNLPYLYDELAGGGHVAFQPSPRTRIGLTGYGATVFFDNALHHTAPMQLDFRPSARTPRGGPYGAVGVNGRTTWRELNFFGEAARSFDGQTGGGFGVEQRSVWSPKGHELELSLRFYDDRFSNPFGRPIAGPDEVDGTRAANELGARVRYAGKLNEDWGLRGRLESWVNPYGARKETNISGQVRADFKGWDFFRPSFWVEAKNRNLVGQTTGPCDTTTTDEDTTDTCGDFYKLGGRVASSLMRKKLNLVLQTTFAWREDARYRDRLRNDLLLWAEVRYQPLDFLQLRARSRYKFEDISDNTYLQQNWLNYVEVAWLVRKGTRLALRYDAFVWLDQRDSTRLRIPYPVEHRFLLDLRLAF